MRRDARKRVGASGGCLGVILSRVFSGGGKRAGQRDRGETGGSSGRKGKKARGGPGNERPAARVHLIDAFRLEIFAAPYARNRRAGSQTKVQSRGMTTTMMMMMTTSEPSPFLAVIAILREIASRYVASGLSSALTSADPFHYRDRYPFSLSLLFLVLSFVQNVYRYIGIKKFINPRDACGVTAQRSRGS